MEWVLQVRRRVRRCLRSTPARLARDSPPRSGAAMLAVLGVGAELAGPALGAQPAFARRRGDHRERRSTPQDSKLAPPRLTAGRQSWVAAQCIRMPPMASSTRLVATILLAAAAPIIGTPAGVHRQSRPTRCRVNREFRELAGKRGPQDRHGRRRRHTPRCDPGIRGHTDRYRVSTPREGNGGSQRHSGAVGTQPLRKRESTSLALGESRLGGRRQASSRIP